MTSASSLTLLLTTLLVLGAGAVPARASEPAASGASSEALRVARASQPGWRLGRLLAREHDGRREVRAELLSGATPVAWLRVDPATGRFLPRGERPARGPDAVDPARLRPQVARAIADLELGTWAWPVEHGRAWAVPLRWAGRVVAAIRIDVRRTRVLAAEHDDEDDDDD
jgi:hypothetical protein